MQKIQLVFLLLVGLFGSCVDDESAKPESCELRPSYVTLREYKKAEGIIRAGNDPGSYYIEVTRCDDCPYVRPIPDGLTNLGLHPCTIPARFKKDNLSISFTGSAKIDTAAVYGAIDISGIPFQINTVEVD